MKDEAKRIRIESGTKPLLRAGYVRLIIRVAVLALIGFVVFTKVFIVTQALGNDMFPAIKDGDLVIAFRMQRSYSKNDVVVCSFGGKRTVGRIAALHGDVVTLDESGVMLVNGTAQEGEIAYPTYAKEGLTYPYRVPEGAVFVLGDHRTKACDSRDYGAVLLDDVDGKVITILRRKGL